MKIQSVETIIARRSGQDGIPRWNPTMVRIRTDDGLEGVGEIGLAYGVGGTGSLGVVHDLAEAYLIGKDPFDTELLWETMFRGSFWGEGGGPLVTGAISGLDAAMWDIKGKALGMPVWRMLGGKCQDNLRTYASQIQFGWSKDGLTYLIEPEEYAEQAMNAVNEGYDCLKIDPAMVSPEGERKVNMRGLFDNKRLRLYRARMEAIREAVGPDVDMILELHSFTSLSGALQIADVLQDLNILFMEEPVHYAWPDTHIQVRDRVSMNLAAGERFYTRWGAAKYLQAGALDVFQPDFGLIGGITEGKKVCDLAHMYDVTVQGHVCGGPIATAMALHVEASIPNFEIHEHHAYALQKCNRELCIQDPQPVNGRFKVPDGPGLGITLNEKALKNCERRITTA